MLFFLKACIIIMTIWILALIMVFFHEMGHIVAYLLTYRENNWRVDLGVPGIKLTKIGRFTIYSKTWLGGRAYYWYKKYNPINNAIISLGGCFVNLIFIFTLGFYLQSIHFEAKEFFDWCIQMLYYANIGEFLCCIIPIKTKNYMSDGWSFLYHLGYKKSM